MKTLVIFDSNFGNTQKVAEAIAGELNGRAVNVKLAAENDLSGINLLVVGSPINAWNPTQRTTEFLKALSGKLSGIKAAAFDTRVKSLISGNAAKRMTKLLQHAGAEVVDEPKGFYVNGKEGPLFDGEIEEAKSWAGKLKEKAGVDR